MRRRSWLMLGALALIVAAGAVYLFAGDVLAPGEDGGGAAAERGARAVPVRTVEVEEAALRITAKSVGTLMARDEVELTADARGLVEEVAFEEGERVEEGELLVALEAQEERAELEAARARRDQIERELARARELETSDFATESRVDELEARLAEAEAEVDVAEAHLTERRITAPFGGVIGLKNVSPGTLLTPGTTVATLSTIDPIDLRFDLPAERLPRLEVGQTVVANSDVLGEEAREGEITVIDSDVDPATRTVTLEAALANDDGVLVPGMFMDVEVVLETRPDALMIPERAVLRRGDDTYAFVVTGDGIAQRRPIRTGQYQDGDVHVVEGLDAGEQVVAAGLQQLSDGQKVRRMETDGGDAAASGAPDGDGGG